MKEDYKQLNDLAQSAKTNKKDKVYLCTIFRPMIFATAHKYCNADENFEDWVQCAHLAFCDAIRRFDAGRGLDFAPFSKRYLASALYTVRRQENRYRLRHSHGDDALQAAKDEDSHDPGADLVYERERITEDIRAILRCLDAEDRKLIRWHYEEGRPLAALAAKWGRSKSQIYRQRDRVLRQMQKMWQDPARFRKKS